MNTGQKKTGADFLLSVSKQVEEESNITLDRKSGVEGDFEKALGWSRKHLWMQPSPSFPQILHSHSAVATADADADVIVTVVTLH